MNCEAMHIPSEKLVRALQDRIAKREDLIQKNNERAGEDRVLIKSGGDTAGGWTRLFKYDVNEVVTDGELALEMELRQRIFWLDNVSDDTNQHFIFCPTYLYSDITLFGQEVTFGEYGVPCFSPHPISKKADISLIAPFDFRSTGAMPIIFRSYEKMYEIAEEQNSDDFFVTFPDFIRGPLDVYVQLRGYENFIADTVDCPEFVHEFFSFIVEQRGRYSRERLKYLETKAHQPPVPSQVRVDDDWVNVPYITPHMFKDYLLPAYRQIQDNEGPVEWFHTCGNCVPIVEDLLQLFSNITMIDVSQKSDPTVLDEILPQNLAFLVNLFNTFILAESEDKQRKHLESIAKIGKHRKVILNLIGIVQLHDSFEEDLFRLNRFIRIAREILSPETLD